MNAIWERVAIFAFGVIFVSVLLLLVFVFPNPTPFQYETTRIILALATASIATLLTGFLTVEIPRFLKAGGAFAVFVIVYFYSPAKLVVGEITANTIVSSVNELLRDSYLETALADIANALKVDPLNDRFNNLLGQYYMRVGRYNEAVDAFGVAALNAPRDRQSKYLFNKAAALYEADRFEEAVKVYLEVKKRRPTSDTVLYSLASAQGRAGNFVEARAVLTELLARPERNLIRELRYGINLQLGLIDILEGADGYLVKAISRFREAHCYNADLLPIFLGKSSFDGREYYDSELKIIAKVRDTAEYLRFIEELKSGARCLGSLRATDIKANGTG